VQIERALGGAHLGGGEAQVLGRSSEVAMTKQQLDGAHVGAGFQQMNGKCVPQGMGCDRFGNTATSMRLLARPLYSVPADVALHSIAREEPFLGLFQWPPVAEHFEQLWGEHDIAIFAPLCVAKIYVAMVSQLSAIKASS
jgi:hypothetical protein